MVFPLPGHAPIFNIQDTRKMMNELGIDPLKNSGVRVVHPVGDGSSGVFLVGEAPGQKEDELGEPFVGASGRLLNNELLPSIGLSRKNIYLTNIVKCRPPKNRDPLPEEKDAWSPILLAEILAIKPHLVVCLGRHSLGFFFPDAKISSVHGKILSLKMYDNYTQNVLPLYHPAVALYNPGMRATLLEDFKIAASYLAISKSIDRNPPLDKVQEVKSATFQNAEGEKFANTEKIPSKETIAISNTKGNQKSTIVEQSESLF